VGNLVWIDRPYPAGKYTCVKIFKNCLSLHLDPDNCVEADDAYATMALEMVKCPKCAMNPTENLEMQGRVWSRHKTLNG
jgi:hypothetical protein